MKKLYKKEKRFIAAMFILYMVFFVHLTLISKDPIFDFSKSKVTKIQTKLIKVLF
jgi:hypothetical protein